MIPWQVQKVHGITNEMLDGEPKPDEVLPEFYKFIAGSILVAHNASFDIGFLRHEFALLGMSLNNRSLCTLKMSRKLYPHLPNHKLETVSRYLLGKSCEQMQMHRALDDAKLAGMIWLEMEKMWADWIDCSIFGEVNTPAITVFAFKTNKRYVYYNKQLTREKRSLKVWRRYFWRLRNDQPAGNSKQFGNHFVPDRRRPNPYSGPPAEWNCLDVAQPDGGAVPTRQVSDFKAYSQHF